MQIQPLEHGPTSTRRPRDIIVIGAGVVGMATALTLVDCGHRVSLVDAADGPGLGTSFANGAQLSYNYTDALASPATRAQIPRLLLSLDPAFRMKPGLDPDFLRWGLAFLRNTSAVRFRRNTLEGLTLALESRHALHALAQRHGLEFAHSTPGKLILYRSVESLAAAARTAQFKSAHGADQQVLDPDQTVEIEPMLASVGGEIAGALYSKTEEVGDPHRFCVSALRALESAHPAVACFRTMVDRISLAGGRPELVTAGKRKLDAELVILCTGTGSVALARSLGARLPIIPMKGYSITTTPGIAPPSISVTDASRRVVFAKLGERIRIAGLAELGNRNPQIEPRRLDSLVRSARQALPQAADYDSIETAWAGLRPMTPDSLPITRMIAPGVIANTGHGALGWTYAAGSARRVAAIIEAIG